MLHIKSPALILRVACFLAFTIPAISNAQNFNDPYSSYGIGRIQEEEFSFLEATPALALTQKGDASYSLKNPASLSSIEYMTFNVGMNGKLSELKRADSTYNESRAGFGHIAIGFPVIQDIGWGASLGLVPVSQMGYRYQSWAGSDQDYKIRESGDGGLSKFFVSNGIDLSKNLSAGFTAAYVFGNIDQATLTEFGSTQDYYREVWSENYGDFAFQAGLQYHANIGEELELGVGASGRIPSSLSMNRDFLSLSYFYQGSSYEVDTVAHESDIEGTLEMPAIYDAGLTLSKSKHWKIGISASYKKWSKLEKMGRDQGLKDAYDIGLSGQLIPDADDVGSYWSQVKYRLGINYANTYLNFNDETIKMYSANLGFGFPLSRQKSTINAAFQFGTLGKDENNLFQENYFGFNIGFTLNEKWFEKDRIK